MRAPFFLSGVLVVAGCAGCGFTGAATSTGPTEGGAGFDAAGASPSEGGTDLPSAGSNEIPIEGLDAGADGSTALPRFEIVAPSGGKFRILAGAAATPCSVASGQPATFVVNNLSTATVRIAWVDYGCSARDYGTASAGNSRTQPTFVSHRWRIRSDVGGATLGEFVLDAPGTYQVIVR